MNPALANRMILITGSTRAQPESLLPGANPLFLYKPFSRSELIDAISRAFDEQASGPNPLPRSHRGVFLHPAVPAIFQTDLNPIGKIVFDSDLQAFVNGKQYGTVAGRSTEHVCLSPPESHPPGQFPASRYVTGWRYPESETAPRKAMEAYRASRDNLGIASSQNRANAPLAAMKKTTAKAVSVSRGSQFVIRRSWLTKNPSGALHFVSNVSAGEVQIFGNFTVVGGETLGLFVAENCASQAGCS